MRRAYCLLLSVILAGVLALPAVVYAEEEEEEERPDDLGWSYLYDGGAVPFFWAPLLGDRALTLWVQPRSSPLFFDAGEGGARSRIDEEVPGWQVNLGASLMNLYIAVGDSHDSRWFHVKGMAESLLTSTIITGVGKAAFGRHRPDYDPAINSRTSRQSFPSGHSTTTLAGTTYFALYMYYHGFERWRPNGTFTWWEGLTYASLAALSIYVPYSRVIHNRHHASDAIAGSLLGFTTSTALFYWQERRYQRAASRLGRSEKRSVLRPVVIPDWQERTIWLAIPF